MRLRTGRVAATVLLCLAFVAIGCKKAPTQNADGSVTNPDGSVTFPAGSQQATQEAPANAPAGQQGALNSDGTRTNTDGSVTYPPASQVAQQESQPAVRNQPAVAPVVRVVPAGTQVIVRLDQALSSKQNEVGDGWTGVLDQPLLLRGGGSVFKRGTPVSGTVVASKGKGRFAGAGDLGIEMTAIGRERVVSSEFEKEEKGQGKRTGAFIGGGTGLGAIIGGIAGGGKGAVIGGLAGAGAGTAGAATGRRDVVIPAESIVTFSLRESLSVR